MMKALRVKIPNSNPSKSVFRFILLYTCAQVDLNYQATNQLAFVTLITNDGETYTFNKHMPSYEFELFQFRYTKFLNSDELFFNLSEFQLSQNKMGPFLLL
jgi:hypothetical protein